MAMNHPARLPRLAAFLALALAGSLADAKTPTSHSGDADARLDGPSLAKACAGRDGWTDPAPPARLSANSWYVGTCGISAVLVTGEAGHVLVDAGMPEAAPLVLANIRKLGIDPGEVRWIVASHEHYDHVGGLAALQRATGARVAALPAMARLLASGTSSADDPQAKGLPDFAPVHVDKVLGEGESLVLGNLVLTPHATPAHSPGSTSWTWQSCDAAANCEMIAYADSASTISSEDYRFTDHPDRIAQVSRGLDAIAALPCDLLVTPHPSASQMMPRLAGEKPLVDPQACTRYAQAAQAAFAARLSRESGTPPK